MNQTKYKICKLNEVAWFQEGPGVRKSQFRTSGVKLLNVGNICDRELVLDKTSIYISEEEAYGKYKHFLVDEGDLLIASSGIKVDYFDKKITFARKEHLPLCMNTSTIRFKVLDKTHMDLHYLRHFLASRYFTKQVQFYITGSAQLNFGPSHLNKMTIILPPLEEQKKIAKILDKADEIRAKKKLANDKLDEFLKSTFISMFGDPRTNNKNWHMNTLEGIVANDKHSIKRGPFGGSLKKEIFKESGYLVYEQTHAIHNDYNFARYYIDEKKYKEMQIFKVVPGDLIISCSGVTLGRISEIPPNAAPGIINQALLKISLNPEIVDNKYFIALFRDRYVQNKIFEISRGSGIPNIPSVSVLKQLQFMTPPIELQNKFAQIVEHVEAQKQKNELVIEQMNNLFNSLSQRAFKGNWNNASANYTYSMLSCVNK